MNVDFEYAGDCAVCNEPVDLSDVGHCDHCGHVFHWGYCGGAVDAWHFCDNCMTEGEEKIAHDDRHVSDGV